MTNSSRSPNAALWAFRNVEGDDEPQSRDQVSYFLENANVIRQAAHTAWRGTALASWPSSVSKFENTCFVSPPAYCSLQSHSLEPR